MKDKKYSCGTDDITFCYNSYINTLEKCENITCFRHVFNILHKDIPHSFSLLRGTPLCNGYKKNGE